MSISIDFQDFISWNQISKGHVQQIKPLNWIEKTEMTIQTPTPPAAGDSASHVLSATYGCLGTEVSFGPQIRLCSWKVFQPKPLILAKMGHHSHVTTPSSMRICVTLDTTKTVPDSSRVWASIPELPSDCSNAPILSPKRSWRLEKRGRSRSRVGPQHVTASSLWFETSSDSWCRCKALCTSRALGIRPQTKMSRKLGDQLWSWEFSQKAYANSKLLWFAALSAICSAHQTLIHQCLFISPKLSTFRAFRHFKMLYSQVWAIKNHPATPGTPLSSVVKRRCSPGSAVCVYHGFFSSL